MNTDVLELADLRSVEEITAHQFKVRDAIHKLEKDWEGQPFDEAARERYAALRGADKDLDLRAREIAKRLAYIERVMQNPANIDRGMDLGGWHGDPRVTDPAVQMGLRAIDRHAGAHRGNAGETLENMVRYDDPTGIGARYLDAVGSPDYMSAFGKMLADPTTGHLRFGPREVDAVRKVSAVMQERAMSVGTGSAGGFAVPYVLDPSIIMSGSGATNPVRSVARVITISGARDSEGAQLGRRHGRLRRGGGRGHGRVANARAAGDQHGSVAGVRSGSRSRSAQDLHEGFFIQLLNLAEKARNVTDATQFLTGTGSNAPGGIRPNIGGTGGTHHDAAGSDERGRPHLRGR